MQDEPNSEAKTDAETPSETPTSGSETPSIPEETLPQDPLPEPKIEELPPQETTPTPTTPPEPEVKEIIKEVKIVDQEEVQKQLEERLKSSRKLGLIKANQTRSQRKQKNLEKILALAQKGPITNQKVRDLLQVSQSTATSYLKELLKNNRLKSIKKSNYTLYTS